MQLYDLESDFTEKKNPAEQHPERVKAMADALTQIIRNGRSTPGPKQDNEGWPNTISKPVRELLPQLKE